MVTITLEDKDAIELLQVASHDLACSDPTGDAGSMVRVIEQLRCALLVCDCSAPTATAP